MELSFELIRYKLITKVDGYKKKESRKKKQAQIRETRLIMKKE